VAPHEFGISGTQVVLQIPPDHGTRIFWHQLFLEWTAENFVAPVAEHPFHGGIEVRQTSFSVKANDSIQCRLLESGPSRFAHLQVFLRMTALRDFLLEFRCALCDAVLEFIVGLAQFGVAFFDLREHLVEAIHQMPDFVIRFLWRTDRIVPLDRDHLRRPRQLADGTCHLRLQSSGKQRSREQTPEQNETEHGQVLADAGIDVGNIGFQIKAADGLAVIENVLELANAVCGEMVALCFEHRWVKYRRFVPRVSCEDFAIGPIKARTCDIWLSRKAAQDFRG
jgi:hypothetical protein